MILVSVVTPVYGCKTSLHELYLRVKQTVEQITDNFELIFVNDNSPDNPWPTIVDLHNRDNRVKGICLSKNFGQHKAIYAGLTKAKGQWVVVMDCDLQDRPEEILNFYNTAINTGSQVVLGRRENRRDNFIKKTFSKVFYKVLGYLTDTRQDSAIANFGIYNTNVVQAVCSMGDSFKYFPAMVKWVGFKQTTLNIEHDERKYGKTSYSIKKLVQLGLDVIIAFSEKPLRLTIKLGLVISSFTFLLLIIELIRYFNGNIKVLGYTSLILSIWFFGGLTIFIIGVVGLYIGKTFDKVKSRPVFIIDQELN